MKKEDKSKVIGQLSAELDQFNHFYLVDIEAMNAKKTSDLRRACFKRDIKLVVVKNTLLEKALEAKEGNFSELYTVLKGNTAVMFCDNSKEPAKLIKELGAKTGIPALKGAYVQESIFVGANQLDALTTIKSREELIGDVIALLQSPAKNVLSALQSGGNILHGVLKTLGERE